MNADQDSPAPDRPVPEHQHQGSPELVAQDDDLQRSMVSLAALTMKRSSLDQLLTRVAEYAVQAIPGADGAGLTLLEEGRSDTIVATAPFVRDVDHIQYGLGQGPCISAAAEGRTMMSGSLGGDGRWPQFGSKVARLGIHSAVSLALVTEDGVLGAMNVYARAKHVFDDRAAELGELYAVPAAIAVQNAQVLAQAQRLTEQLRAALDSREVVDRAIGILMGRSGVSGPEALDRLRRLSQHEHRKLRQVAEQIVDEAVRRARIQHSSD
jgi:GAF domain-containing protein